ncbi:hypothetical protein BC2230_100169 [Burkholderia cepacia]
MRRVRATRTASPRISTGWNGWWPSKAGHRGRRVATRSPSSTRWSARSCCRARSPAPSPRWPTKSSRRGGTRSPPGATIRSRRHDGQTAGQDGARGALAPLFDRPRGLPQRLPAQRRMPCVETRAPRFERLRQRMARIVAERIRHPFDQPARLGHDGQVAEHFRLTVMDQLVREKVGLPAARCDNHAETPECQRRTLAEAECIGARAGRTEHDARRLPERADGCRRARITVAIELPCVAEPRGIVGAEIGARARHAGDQRRRDDAQRLDQRIRGNRQRDKQAREGVSDMGAFHRGGVPGRAAEIFLRDYIGLATSPALPDSRTGRGRPGPCARRDRGDIPALAVAICRFVKPGTFSR